MRYLQVQNTTEEAITTIIVIISISSKFLNLDDASSRNSLLIAHNLHLGMSGRQNRANFTKDKLNVRRAVVAAPDMDELYIYGERSIEKRVMCERVVKIQCSPSYTMSCCIAVAYNGRWNVTNTSVLFEFASVPNTELRLITAVVFYFHLRGKNHIHKKC